LYHPAVSGGGAGRVIRDARGRRVRELDRYGETIATLAWASDGTLAAVAVRLPDRSWLEVEPRAAHDPRWGDSDLFRHGVQPLTHCAAIDWTRVDAIPPLAEPARLPPGGGTAVLNVVAALAADQARGPLPYRGPYPTEQLFLALLECFHWEPEADTRDPLAAFMAGALRWSPAPHTRAFAPGGVYVQTRERVDKVVWRGRAYYRADWQGVQRHTTYRLHDGAGGRVHGSLWALGTPLEEHLALAADGTVLAAAVPAAEEAPVQPLAPAVTAGLAAVVVAASAPPLAEALRAVMSGLAFEWAPLSGDLAVLAGERVQLALRLRRALADRVAAASRAEQVRLGFAALADLAHALGDGLRARAQARLSAASLAAQATAVGRVRAPANAAAAAREIGVAVEALLEDAVSCWRERSA
jgi:hypothetical protein